MVGINDQNKENRRQDERRKNLETPNWVEKTGERRKEERRVDERREGK